MVRPLKLLASSAVILADDHDDDAADVGGDTYITHY